MTNWKCFGAMIVIVSVLPAQQVVEDPVMKIRNERASSGEGDLPPVPRGVLEPPPLPAPETHVKDTRGWRASRSARKARHRIVKGTKRRSLTSRIKKVPKRRP